MAGLAMLLAIVRPVATLAQASSYEVGGPAHQVDHSVDILNCCAHFTVASDSTPETNITVSGPPWALQPGINNEYGSATASSSSQISGASPAGVSVDASASGSASPGILPGWALRAASSQGGTYYSFVLDQPSYVEMHGSAGYSHSAGASFAASVSLRAGSSAGAIISGFSLTVNSASNPTFTSGTINAPSMLLSPGTYVLVGALSGDASAYLTGNAETFSASLRVTLQIHPGPDGDRVGTVMCIQGNATITRPGGSPQAISRGAPIYMGDIIETGADGRACILFIDDTQFHFSENTKQTIDRYVYDPDAGKENYSFLAATFRYVSGLMAKEPDPNIQLDAPMGSIGPRGTEFIGDVGNASGTDWFYLAQGSLALTPWHTGVTTVVDAPATIAMSDSGVVTSPLSQADYDALKASVLPQPDADGDAIPDEADNCALTANPTQCDSDGDGFGNRCDGDMNNNTVTNNQDYGLFRAQLGQPSPLPTYNKGDINCNGTVNNQDYGLFRGLLGAGPGPSGLGCAGTVPCP